MTQTKNQQKQHDFLILGATGMQGKIVTQDLIGKGYQIFISSRRQENLIEMQRRFPSLSGQTADLSNPAAIIKLIKTARPAVIINCAEGDWNLDVYRAALKGKTHVVDLGSDIPTTKAQIDLNQDFKKRGLIGITGCGSTPGINNVMLSYALSQFDSVDVLEAGFAWTSNIKKFVVPFSMESIIEEFTQRAPVVEGGAWGEKLPLKTITNRKFRAIGTQKCFLVRHPEPYTFFHYYKNLGVQDIRFYAGFPDHSFNVINALIGNGKSLKKNGRVYVENKGYVSLADLTKVLQDLHLPPKDYTEKENLWVAIHGSENGRNKAVIMECIVPTLANWEEAGCNIDTGFPASIIAQMILNKTIGRTGSFAPELIVPHKEFFLALQKRKMQFYMNGERLGF